MKRQRTESFLQVGQAVGLNERTIWVYRDYMRERYEAQEAAFLKTGKARRIAKAFLGADFENAFDNEGRRLIRKLLRKQYKDDFAEARRIQAERNQPEVDEITISIEWRKSRTWGANPHAIAEIRYKSGRYERREGFTCSGCGYDKESTVIGQIFNAFLKYKLYRPEYIKDKKLPYGMERVHYGQGIGTDCYYSISDAIGGTFERVASGKSFDVYHYKDQRTVKEA